MSGFSWGLFQLINFVPVNGPYFPVYFYICDFFVVEKYTFEYYYVVTLEIRFSHSLRVCLGVNCFILFCFDC